MALIGGILTLSAWLYLLLGRGRFWHVRAGLPHRAAGKGTVAVVVPARNEAAHVGEAVASILAQDYPAFRLFLVDDHSEDGTAGYARQAACAAGAPERLTVLRARELPPGWTGKLWAVSQGVRSASQGHPDYVWFTDADIVHGRDTLARLVATAEHGGFDLVSLMVRLRAVTFAERSLLPAYVFFFFKLYPPRWIADPRRKTAGAAGGCMLIRREALERIGGIAAIRGAVIDDCTLAAAVKSAGGKAWLGLAEESSSLREYAAFGEIGGLISRTAFAQLGHSAWLLAGTVAGMFVVYLLPPLLLLSGSLAAAAMGAAAWLLMSAAYSGMLRHFGLSVLRAPLLPLAALFYCGATLHSAIQYWRGAGGSWKGRAQDARRAGK